MCASNILAPVEYTQQVQEYWTHTSVNPVRIFHVHILPPTRSKQILTSSGRASFLLTESARDVILRKTEPIAAVKRRLAS